MCVCTPLTTSFVPVSNVKKMIKYKIYSKNTLDAVIWLYKGTTVAINNVHAWDTGTGKVGKIDGFISMR